MVLIEEDSHRQSKPLRPASSELLDYFANVVYVLDLARRSSGVLRCWISMNSSKSLAIASCSKFRAWPNIQKKKRNSNSNELNLKFNQNENNFTR